MSSIQTFEANLGTRNEAEVASLLLDHAREHLTNKRDTIPVTSPIGLLASARTWQTSSATCRPSCSLPTFRCSCSRNKKPGSAEVDYEKWTRPFRHWIRRPRLVA